MFSFRRPIGANVNEYWSKYGYSILSYEYVCRESFKILMIIFKELNKYENYDMTQLNTNIRRAILDNNEYVDEPIKRYEIIDKKDNYTVLNYISDIIDSMTKNITIYQHGKKGEIDFYYKIIINDYLTFKGLKRIEITKKNAIMYIYPYRKRFGEPNLQLNILNFHYDKLFRIHYEEKKDKINKPLIMSYGMTIFREMNVIFPDVDDPPLESDTPIEELNIEQEDAINFTPPSYENTGVAVTPVHEYYYATDREETPEEGGRKKTRRRMKRKLTLKKRKKSV